MPDKIHCGYNDHMADQYHCWKCQAVLEDLLLPLARLAECSMCGADLHVCRMCQFYDTGVADACRETVAEPVNDKVRANFCGYLVFADAGRLADRDEVVESSRHDLESLFGLTHEDKPAVNPPDELNALFDLTNDDGRK
tara:strand:+ start:297 stop:713 length:417 start_codon:yes stop_codon:yes gene_type:complete